MLNNPLRYVDPTGHISYSLTTEQLAKLILAIEDARIQTANDVAARVAGWGLITTGSGLMATAGVGPMAVVGLGSGLMTIASAYDGTLINSDYELVKNFLASAQLAAKNGSITISIDHEGPFGGTIVLSCDKCITTKISDYRAGLPRNPAAVSMWGWSEYYAGIQYTAQITDMINNLFDSEHKGYLPLIQR